MFYIGSSRYDYDEYSFQGGIDEVRVSSVAQYTTAFTESRHLSANAGTIALFHLDEGSGVVTRPETPAGVIGLVNGPTWIAE